MRVLIALLFVLSACSKSHQIILPIKSGYERSHHEATGKDYVIASQGNHTTDAGKKMFELGGNAVDAAVAMSFAISVERPHSTGIGGGGFMLIKIPGTKEPLAVDFREKAPLSAHSKMYLDKDGNEVKGKSLDGIFSVGVPGLVAGVLEVHKKYGKLKLSQVIEPAVKVARNGFKIYPELEKAIKGREDVLRKFDGSRKIFVNKNGELLKTGDLLVQEDLAKTLEEIAKKGRDGFYKGWVAKGIVAENLKLGGLITQKDLDAYDVKYRTPVYGQYKDFEIYSMSPPSSGGTHIVQILNTVENDGLKKFGPHHPRSVHLVSAAMQQAFADRAKHLGDSDFSYIPVKELTSKKYAKEVRQQIKENKARRKDEVMAGKFTFKEHDETTHFSVMDKNGYTVVSTQTINGWFGSGVVAEGTGVILNNEMDDFATKVGAMNLFGAVGGEKNLVESQKRPLSSMSPTIVLKDAKPVLGVGTPSGTRILTCVMHTILNYIEYELPLFESVAALRFHHQWAPDKIRFEKHVEVPKILQKKLTDMGYDLMFKNLGCKIQAVADEGKTLRAVADPRGEGKAVGL